MLTDHQMNQKLNVLAAVAGILDLLLHPNPQALMTRLRPSYSTEG